MGVVKCPACGGTVSEMAAACPHCSGKNGLSGCVPEIMSLRSRLTDIHAHLVPGVDDGSVDLDMTMEMIRSSYRQGGNSGKVQGTVT